MVILAVAIGKEPVVNRCRLMLCKYGDAHPAVSAVASKLACEKNWFVVTKRINAIDKLLIRIENNGNC